MAKRKGKAKSRKKKNQGASLVSVIRRIFVLAALVVICFTSGKKPVAVEQKKQPADPVKEKPADKKPAIVPPRPKTTTFKVPANAEIPKLKAKRSEQVIRHEGYTVSYNSDYKIANWVAYELTAEEAKSKKTERSNKFVPDPMVKGATATNEDYTRTGYDRGHMAPAGDMKWSAKGIILFQ